MGQICWVVEVALPLGAVSAAEIRWFVELALILGAWYLGVTFVLPLGLIGLAWRRGYDLHDKGQNWTNDGILWLLTAAAALTLMIALNNYSAAVDACNKVNREIEIYEAMDRVFGTNRATQAQLEFVTKKCGTLPFTSYS